MGLTLDGKTGVIFGVANQRSIAWACARSLADAGMRLAVTYANERLEKSVRELAAELKGSIVLPCDVTKPEQIDAVMDSIRTEFGGLDSVIHAVAFAKREELEGDFFHTSKEGYMLAHEVSAYSLTEITRKALPLMEGREGSIVTLTYLGGERVIKNYNVMGIAKAALEASVRYLAGDLGKHGIRVNALSAGPMRTLAGAGVSDGRYVYNWTQANAPLRRNPLLEEVGNAGLYLISPLSGGVTGEIHSVDCGYSVVGMGVVPEKG
ncbi:MAG: enoyl-ACP reductase [Planctomycetaceae bacterium]|nr:enoyl-ACP reductase [Planctomycetaceae bacterium]